MFKQVGDDRLQVLAPDVRDLGRHAVAIEEVGELAQRLAVGRERLQRPVLGNEGSPEALGEDSHVAGGKPRPGPRRLRLHAHPAPFRARKQALAEVLLSALVALCFLHDA